MSGSQQTRCQHMMVLRPHSHHCYRMCPAGLRKSDPTVAALSLCMHVSVRSCSSKPVWLSREAAAAAEITQKMTRRLKRRYDEIHHTAPVSFESVLLA